MFRFISDSAHYSVVLDQLQHAKRTLWIGTADIKDLYIETNGEKKPFVVNFTPNHLLL